jgi:hypothetical protein
MEEIFNKIKQDVNTPFVVRGCFDPSLYTWDDVSYYLNNYGGSQTILELIDFRGSKVDLPKLRHDWFEYAYNIETIYKCIVAGYSFVYPGMGRYSKFINYVCGGLERHFPGFRADAHVYGGLKSESKSFSIHNDAPNNLILQFDGTCRWQVWTCKAPQEIYQDPVIDTFLSPGDIVYIPSRMMHNAEPQGKRLSISFPFRNCTFNYPSDRKWYDIDKQEVYNF